MSRTDLDPATIARAARRMAGDGSIEWVMEPIQASVLLDVADMLDENAKLRVERDEWHRVAVSKQDIIDHMRDANVENAKLRELLGDALKTLFYKRLDGSVGCTENCPRWQFSKDCQLVDGCWLELEAAKLGIEVDG